MKSFNRKKFIQMGEMQSCQFEKGLSFPQIYRHFFTRFRFKKPVIINWPSLVEIAEGFAARETVSNIN